MKLCSVTEQEMKNFYNMYLFAKKCNIEKRFINHQMFLEYFECHYNMNSKIYWKVLLG